MQYRKRLKKQFATSAHRKLIGSAKARLLKNEEVSDCRVEIRNVPREPFQSTKYFLNVPQLIGLCPAHSIHFFASE